jgi:hypothetical protein
MVDMRDLRYAVGGGDAHYHMICNPSRDDDTPSLAIYANGAYDFGTGVAYTIPEALALLGKDDAVLPLYTEVRTATPRRRSAPSGSVSWGLIATWNLCLLAGPRRQRISWLLARGLSHATVNRYRLGHTGTAFSIPIPLAGGYSYKLRRDDRYSDPDAPRYRNPKGMPTVLYRPNPRGVTSAICEGELDALLLAQLGIDAITSTGGAGDLVRRIRGIALPRRVYILTDQDDAGEQAAVAIREARPATDWVRVHWDQGKDVTDALAVVSDAERVSTLRRWLRCP